MIQWIKTLLLSTLMLGSLNSHAATSSDDMVYVGMTTNAGYIELALNRSKAPVTVANFLEYVNDGFYDNTLFHRVVPGFVIQGGGYTPDMVLKANRPAIRNEAKNGLANDRGTIAMARKVEVDSANSQFFINLEDNKRLNHGVRDYGYAVFGKVIKGMDVVDAIAAVPLSGSEPVTPVILESVKVLEAPTMDEAN